MIDTMYIFCKLKNLSEYEYIKSKINDATQNKPKGNFHKDKNCDNAEISFGLSQYGFTEIKLRKVLSEKYKYYFIEIKLRLKLLVDEGNYIDVIYAHEIPKARERFNKIVQDILKLNLPDFLNWNVKRIDIAVDLKVNEDDIWKYILLFKRSNIPFNTLENETTMEYFGGKNNLYLCSQNYTINYYDRYKTLLDKQEQQRKKFHDIERAKNKLRIEVQIKVDAGKMKERNKIVTNQVIHFMKLDLCRDIAEYHFNSIIGQGNYYTLNKALSIIDKNVQNCRKKNQLINMLTIIRKSEGIWAAKKYYLSISEDKKKAMREFYRLINGLRKLNINPVTLPEDFETEELKGLQDQIHTYFVDQKRKVGY